jgi:DNA uptake protein ComE-like DNA-binding protein
MAESKKAPAKETAKNTPDPEAKAQTVDLQPEVQRLSEELAKANDMLTTSQGQTKLTLSKLADMEARATAAEDELAALKAEIAAQSEDETESESESESEPAPEPNKDGLIPGQQVSFEQIQELQRKQRTGAK